MNFFLKMFRSGKLKADDVIGQTSGELITLATDGKLLVDGKATYEHAQTSKHDLTVMQKCCESELEKFRLTGMTPAPFYFERVAILARKEKRYDLEVEICEQYLEITDRLFDSTALGVKVGPRHLAIVNRLPKARELLKKHT
ncbi:hypothetical protein HJ202_24205 [Vibrio parahaemolyticus]|uniref:hypothetical protein n=1 Tax=Vibrio parahaemolyticus TaxID=670 RepID=UPI0028105DDA|nr:hypothetical protein [Vibrio parahaemolyticus]ELB2264126.1 hypothetical protein [Vibrio parahaemolyticus]MBE3723394.1 hypothetical protein [Vibrio parahaemolyticus]